MVQLLDPRMSTARAAVRSLRQRNPKSSSNNNSFEALSGLSEGVTAPPPKRAGGKRRRVKAAKAKTDATAVPEGERRRREEVATRWAERAAIVRDPPAPVDVVPKPATATYEPLPPAPTSGWHPFTTVLVLLVVVGLLLSSLPTISALLGAQTNARFKRSLSRHMGLGFHHHHSHGVSHHLHARAAQDGTQGSGRNYRRWKRGISGALQPPM